MRKTLFSVTAMTVLSLSTILGWSDAPAVLQTAMTNTMQNGHSFFHFLAMGTQEHRNAYNIGLNRIPSAQGLLTSNQIHGQFVKALTRKQALDQFNLTKHLDITFEAKGNKGHFYIISNGILRHFIVENQACPETNTRL